MTSFRFLILSVMSLIVAFAYGAEPASRPAPATAFTTGLSAATLAAALDNSTPDYARRVQAFVAEVKPGQSFAQAESLAKKYGPFLACQVPKGDVGMEIHFKAESGKGCIVVTFDGQAHVVKVISGQHSM